MPKGFLGRAGARCHPNRPLRANGLCNACYVADFKRRSPSYRRTSDNAGDQWRRENKDRLHLLSRPRDRKRNAVPERRETCRNSKLVKQYGITSSDYNAMLESQGRVCAICGWAPKSGQRRLSVDHNHSSKVVRGLLCHVCNQFIAYIETPGRLDVALNYLKRSETNG